LDDYGKRFEYNRWPLKWNDVLDNVQRLIELQRTWSNVKLTINYTVSVFTFLYADEFVLFTKKLGIPKVSWSVLHTPRTYNIKSIDNHTKKRISTTNLFYNLISANPSTNWNLDFFEQVNKLDAKRGTSFTDTFPELGDILQRE
jgi:hypothetical protein